MTTTTTMTTTITTTTTATTTGKEASLGDLLSTVVLKDLNLREAIHLGSVVKPQFVYQLTQDCDFLLRFGVIDYSILVGFGSPSPHQLKQTSKMWEGVKEKDYREPSMFKQIEGGILGDGVHRKKLYFFGIVDILQVYNLRKQLEHQVKGIVYDKDGLSVTDPSVYCKRFLRFLTNSVE